MKAFKEGRTPQPGPPGGENAESPTVIAFSPGTAPSAPPSTDPSSNPPQAFSNSQKKIPVYQPTAPSGPIDFTKLNVEGEDGDEEDIGYSEKDRKAIQSAGKHAKFAMSALLYDDVKTAIQNLEQALSMLKPIKIIEDLV